MGEGGKKEAHKGMLIKGDTNGRCPDTHVELTGNVASLPSETRQIPNSVSSSHLWSDVVKTGCWQWCWAHKQQSSLAKPIERSFDESF